MNGRFLSLDGIDGTGKSTQVRLLADWLRERGHTVATCIDPGGTAVGTQIRELLLAKRYDLHALTEALLFMASRVELIERIVRPALESGSVVISDRFLLATVVYQGHAGGLDVNQLWTLGRFATGGLEPDLTLVLDLPLERALERRGRSPDRMESKDRAFHERVRAGFQAEAAWTPERIRVIDASPGVDEVQARIRQEVERVLGTHPRA